MPAGTVRILDPGAGVGILSAAVCQRVLSLPGRRDLEIDAWENDEHLAPFLRRTLEHCRAALEAHGHQIKYTIHRKDFILDNALGAKSLFDGVGGKSSYDVAIMNPPYFKLRKDSDHAPLRFRDLGLQISTGPVVTFRATEHLLRERASREKSAPLLMMHNIRPFATVFPDKPNGKPGHFRVCEASRSLLLPARRYVLLKRFTAKEERRRLVAGVLERSDSYAPFVALENHVNYVYKASGELSRDEAFGLAALFNSALLDRYFRAISGSTQVNATEIRTLPLPGWPEISEIGRRVSVAGCPDLKHIEQAIAHALCLPVDLNSYLAGC